MGTGKALGLFGLDPAVPWAEPNLWTVCCLLQAKLTQSTFPRTILSCFPFISMSSVILSFTICSEVLHILLRPDLQAHIDLDYFSPTFLNIGVTPLVSSSHITATLVPTLVI